MASDISKLSRWAIEGAMDEFVRIGRDAFLVENLQTAETLKQLLVFPARMSSSQRAPMVDISLDLRANHVAYNASVKLNKVVVARLFSKSGP